MVKESAFLFVSFVGLSLLVALLFPLAVHAAGVRSGLTRGVASRRALLAAAGTAAWMAATGAAAARGLLRFDTAPPTFMLLVAAIFAVALGVGFSPLGRRLAAGVPLAVLVAAQGFRFPLELLLHQAYVEGLMPVQMSFSGLNFDILTGISALVVAPLVARGVLGVRAVRVWNVAGILLLANIVTIAMLSTPTPLRVFHAEPANVWVAAFPYVWLPAVMVATALLGHVLVARRLRMEAEARAGAAATTGKAAVGIA
jgi:hypothetical protein